MVSAGALNAVVLICEAQRLVIADYLRRVRPGAMADALDSLEGRLGATATEGLLADFVELFPPDQVCEGVSTVADYLAGSSGGVPHRELALEELVLLWLANANPAFSPFRELFDDAELQERGPYQESIEELRTFFSDEPAVDASSRSLIDELLRPIEASPRSLEGQLAFIRTAWARLLGPLLARLLTGLDLLAEERRPDFGLGPGPAERPSLAGLADDREAFSADLDWMPSLVLIAKNAYVWLGQLSRTYGRAITTLDQIPDDELDRLAGWGFTGLWLIGVWERSPASERIKKMMGDEEAVASAYSLLDYTIANELGGEAAFCELRDRAWRRGIRLATDMVPNHVGIDSRWVIEHPDWFVGLDESPFPSYSFTGPDLCGDERVGIYLEDHYWDRSDAAVVFKRVDHWTGDARYIYHGNDGTSMPWNDTAQLDYCNPEVREAVIQTILHVARLSPVIRFDAAMTLTKRHYQRLWFPEPGAGGDIPSRAGLGMSREDFDRAMPREFWREVVDRVAAEAPDTLLLAEAFWLLEGYFVRSLGMHRVYNSAFMNMLRDERNQDYRRLILETLDFDPQILKRYVNFMSNPDERTAIDQFGSGDKYFGIATMMATLPGLPMFGHGQIEGFTEKYGMEFRRARWDERPDEELVRRHERQVFPLLHRRRSFAEADHFALYEFVTQDGQVDENVFAYSNRGGDDRTLVVYHNRYADTRGRLRGVAGGPGLAEALELAPDPDLFVVFRDAVGGLEYIRASTEIAEQGLYAELGAYDLHVFVDLRELRGARCRDLCDLLGGRGVASIDEELAALEPEPVAAFEDAGIPPHEADTTRRAWLAQRLPLALVAAVLLTVAAVDISHLVRTEAPNELRLLEVAELRFEPRDRLVDFSGRDESSRGIPVEPVHELTEGWGDTNRVGMKTTGERATMTLRLPSGGHRTLFLQGHRDRDQPAGVRLLVELNGVECGLFVLERRLRVYRMQLPEGLVSAGENRIELTLLTRQDPRQPAAGRYLVLRRLALAMDPAGDLKTIMRQRSVKLEPQVARLTIRAPGRLLIRFDLPNAGSFLSFDYCASRQDRSARARVGVGRRYDDLQAVDIMAERRLNVADGEIHRQFLFMGHHTGPSLLWFELVEADEGVELEVLDPRLSASRRRPN
jgi:glycosidase